MFQVCWTLISNNLHNSSLSLKTQFMDQQDFEANREKKLIFPVENHISCLHKRSSWTLNCVTEKKTRNLFKTIFFRVPLFVQSTQLFSCGNDGDKKKETIFHNHFF